MSQALCTLRDWRNAGVYCVRRPLLQGNDSGTPTLWKRSPVSLLKFVATMPTCFPPSLQLYDAYKTVTASKTPKAQEGEVSAGDRGLCFIPDNALWRMHLIVRAMVRRRMVKRCCRIVKNARRPTLLESLRLLARQRFNPKHVNELSWEDLQERITQWRQFVRVAIVVLLASERRICARVFNAPEVRTLSHSLCGKCATLAALPHHSRSRRARRDVITK